MLRVALESTPLQNGHKFSDLRKGIYRYASNLAQCLSVQKEIDFHLFDIDDSISCNDYDILHLPHLGCNGIIIPKHYQNLNPTKIVVTVHDLIYWLFPEKTELSAYKIQQIKAFSPKYFALCPSQNTKQDLIEHLNINPSRIFVTQLYVPKEDFYPHFDKSILKKYKIPDVPYFFYIGRLEDRKGLNYLFKAFSKLILDEKIKDLNLVLVGNLGQEQPFTSYIDEIYKKGLQNRVIHIPYVQEEDLKTLYSHSLALTFLSEYEGFGYPLLEAMHCQTPVICFHNSSLPEVGKDAALYIPDKKIDSICSLLLKVYQNENLRCAAIQKGLQNSKLFTKERFMKETLSAYHSIANNEFCPL